MALVRSVFAIGGQCRSEDIPERWDEAGRFEATRDVESCGRGGAFDEAIQCARLYLETFCPHPSSLLGALSTDRAGDGDSGARLRHYCGTTLERPARRLRRKT
jgi:hypothetical protein